jgi:predicted ArsR family transcriptional regulator
MRRVSLDHSVGVIDLNHFALIGERVIVHVTETILRGAMSARRAKRLAEILELVAERGTISLTELTNALTISAATARRDLAELADRNAILRTHGGDRNRSNWSDRSRR